MNTKGFLTLFYKELLRFYKVSLQTIMAPVITALLYLLIFAQVIGQRIEVFQDVSYASFLIPGLIMMAVIQNAFANSSSSLIQSKVVGNIIFVLMSPLSHLEFFLAFALAAAVRGLVVGFGVYLVAIIFVDLPMHNVFIVLVFAVLCSVTLGVMGIIAGIWAEKFDQLAGFQNFVIMPMSFLSGVFYSIRSLPEVWQTISRFNPFFYMIDGFRYGFFGESDIRPGTSIIIVGIALLLLSLITLWLLKRGYKLRD